MKAKRVGTEIEIGDIVTWKKGGSTIRRVGIVLGWKENLLQVAKYQDNPEAECSYENDPQKECLPSIVYVRHAEVTRREWLERD